MRILLTLIVIFGLLGGCTIWRPLEAPRSGTVLFGLELPSDQIDVLTFESKEAK